MKHIFVVLIESYTGLGKILKRVTGYRFEHIAVSMDKSLTEYVSYSRKQHHHPFKAGFMREYRDYYAFEEYKKFYAKVFAVPVTEEKYEEIQAYVSELENDTEQMFNLFAMVTTPILHGFQIWKTHNCMTFTAKLIEMAGIEMSKPFYKYSIPDIEKLLEDAGCQCKKGYIPRIDSPNYEYYTEPSDMVTVIREFCHVIGELTRRLLKYGTKL